MDYYPEDISQYRNNPRCPLYEEPVMFCAECYEDIEEGDKYYVLPYGEGVLCELCQN